ncbi:hypothetical protein OK015_16835 [Mycobacterium sp. Aquia_216]|uniref:hypothetical protein n=1 Tax=Mycobacterium sp. Aquia_216 TaxID=2991729 RepID=UPI00227B2535|nr:hypothetical protein [Mycobacterium sp. Aquia_216]WAJ42918.1 hypothetical protein OK015_16835 [Mycobacterium sp. Aquia_216]
MPELNHPQPQHVFEIVDAMELDKLATIARIQHTLARAWRNGDDTIAHADGAGKIDDYRVFLDVTPIYV